MDNEQGAQAQIAKVQSDVLRASGSIPLSVGQLEQALLALFPAEDAEPWDRTGLIVGDPAAAIEGVAVALDATASAVSQARACGANVLLTHHPVFIDAPNAFGPLSPRFAGSGSVVYAAIREGVALINFHTALDTSIQAQQVLPSMLSIRQVGVLNPLEGRPQKGYGQLCQIDEGMTIEQLAARCVSVFGSMPRVWGRPAERVEKVVTATGSGGSLIEPCLEAHVDCLVCGELHYHDALAAAEAGLAMIELGHDVSELPLSAVLAAACEQVGLGKEAITMLDQSGRWWTPEATRR